MVELLLNQFQRVSDSPDAIPRLRRFLLDLAVQGKLVDHDYKADAPNQFVPPTIGAVTQRKDRENPRFSKATRTNGPLTVPYQIPSNWRWALLRDVLDGHVGGGTPSKNIPGYWDGDIPWASVKDVGKSKYVQHTLDRITPDGLRNSSSHLVLPGHLIVVTRMGLGKVSINTIPLAINQDLRALSPSRAVSVDYLYIFFKTFTPEGSGLTVKGIRVEDLLGTQLPLPPLEEQHRIVAKVDELMGLCDQLEAAQKERERHRDALRAVSLHRLTATPAEGDTPKNVNFFLKRAERLIAKPEHIGSLRRTILDLSVRGQLTCSNRDRWIKYSLEEICTKITDGTHRTPTYVARGIPFISVKDFSAGRLSFTSTRFIPESEHAQLIQRCKPERGDILIGRIGTIGKPVLVDTDREFSLFVSVGLLKPRTEIVTSDYLRLLLDSPTATVEYDRIKIGGGTHTNKLNLGDLKALSFAIPSVPEQLSIVAKVDQLMMVCEELETALACTQSGRTRLLDSLLSGALAEASRRTPFPRDFSRPTETASLTTTLRGA